MSLALHSHLMNIGRNPHRITLYFENWYIRYSKIKQNQIFEELASFSWADILYDLYFQK